MNDLNWFSNRSERFISEMLFSDHKLLMKLNLETDSEKDSMNQFKLSVQMNLFEFLINDSFVS